MFISGSRVISSSWAIKSLEKTLKCISQNETEIHDSEFRDKSRFDLLNSYCPVFKVRRLSVSDETLVHIRPLSVPFLCGASGVWQPN